LFFQLFQLPFSQRCERCREQLAGLGNGRSTCGGERVR
jgi:hypothetical protein